MNTSKRGAVICSSGASHRFDVLFLTVVIAALLVCPELTIVHAAAGDLDAAFGTAGKVATDFGPGSPNFAQDRAAAIALQPDGKFVVAGRTFGAIPAGMALARYNSNGTLDGTFGSGGKVVATNGSAAAVLIQPDNKILVADTSFDPGEQGIVLLRFNSNGSPDAGFGSNGRAFINLGPGSGASSAVLQSDGKVIVAGAAGGDSERANFATVRFNADGSIDQAFGSSGVVTTDFFNNLDVARAVGVQADGKIVVAGLVTNNSGPNSNGEDFGLVRYDSNGTIDATFGAGGKVTTSFGSLGDTARALVIQPNGKIVAAGSGSVQLFNDQDFALARYNSNGSLDTTFGVGGKTLTDFSSFYDPDALVFSRASGLALQSNGKLVAFGASSDFLRIEFALSRYNPDGSADNGFGDGGRVVTTFTETHTAEAFAGIILANGTIVAAGYYQDIQRGDDFALAGYIGDEVVSPFDICVQDDGSGDLLQINTSTGQYQFTNCRGLTVGGAGSVTRRAGLITLQHIAGDRRVTAKIDASANKATASIQLLSMGSTFNITDRNIANNACVCR